MTPTSDQKISILPHIRYEIEMLFKMLFRMSAGEVETFMKNAVLESVLMHARVLEEFFDSKNRYKDNVMPNDFEFTCKDTGISRNIVDRMHKDLAHLSYSRLDRRTFETKQWLREEFIPQLKTRCVDFVSYIVNGCALDISAKEKRKWIDLLKFLNTDVKEAMGSVIVPTNSRE